MSPENVAEALGEATAIAIRLRSVAPHEARPDDLAACEHALALIHQDRDAMLWRELQLRLGSFLLESPAGDRAANVARARSIYHAALDSPRDDPSWQAAVCGYANSLVANPNVAPEAFHEAFELLESLVAYLRSGPDRGALGIALGCYAMALSSAPVGDVDQLLERALALQGEQIDVLESADRNPLQWGRAHHNLARLYLQRRAGIRTQNVDSAVGASLEALRVRTREADPVGRARTLRGLALAVPEWSGAESQAHADALAAEFQKEADEIAEADPRAARRPGTWGHLAGERSALYQDLDDYMRLPPAEAVPLLETFIARHRSILEGMDAQSMPRQWAEWRAGLGHLLAKRGHFGSADAINQAYECFVRALEAITPSPNPRLYRDINRAMGELCHQVGAWQCALPAYATALALSEHLLDAAAAPESRTRELADMRGFALFGAYAAARLENYDEAVRLAEAGRARSLVEMLAAAEIAASGASPERREEVAAASWSVRALEAELRQLRADDPHAVMQDMQHRLADYLGADPTLLKVRLTNRGLLTRDLAVEYLRNAADLRRARATLRDALARARAENPSALPERLQHGDIVAIAERVGHPIVYALATVWGGAALIVPPGGPATGILLEGITSDVTGDLLFGAGGERGYAAGAMSGDPDALAATLPTVIATLSRTVVAPIVEWLRANDHRRATLIPLGRLGLFPLHAAAPEGGPVLGYAPSARALARALAVAGRAATERVFCGVADPSGSLPFARAEVRAAAAAPQRWAQATVLAAQEATRQAVTDAAAHATHLHFACHGLFRPSDPSASALLLAGDDTLTLGGLLQGDVDLSAAEIAVLSACQTSNPEFRTLPDEVLALSSGLLLAGVPRIVSTMWRVDDRAAALFCQRLYEEMFANQRDVAAAVAAAQHWLRRTTAAELQELVKALRGALLDEDHETDGALSDFWRDLVARDREARPFADPQHWAAFAHTGV